MSKDIAIKEGDYAKQFGGVKKIRINNVGGGTSYWVPEDETVLGTKHITENGTYKASEEVDEHQQNRGWYGYGEVTVSGIGTASGIDPATGEQSTTETDPNTNELVTKKDVTSIAFITYPNKSVYYDGETIDLSGALVCGKTSKGNRWEGDDNHPSGIIPLTEVTVDPQVASYSGATHGEYSSDLEITGFSQPIAASQIGIIKNTRNNVADTRTYMCGINARCIIYGRIDGSTFNYIVASSVNDDAYTLHEKTVNMETGEVLSERTSEGHVSLGYVHDNKTVYYTVGVVYLSNSSRITEIDPVAEASIDDLSSEDKGKLAWTIVHGEEIQPDTGQTITVAWQRTQPDDKKELSTTFDIRVFPSDFGGGGGGSDF